ncbi:MAG: deoxyguanosinetriphosphate triphosphohydrolase [Anaerolineae bacterium]|nr:deoxyguanosinetriphosphate triphosphohydrolase [Anaerolineae bacterium]HRA19908.1 deoxyguanosinetriphosphate triphosphohydrolase [Anaerolineae bacterium]
MSRTPSPSLCTRQMIEAQEEAWLAPYAERSANSRGRRHPAEKHPYRSEFQKDRDRIIHTTAFRRLQYKTQVFINYEGDYYRTRLTHTFEAAQIARTIARALRANPELAEAITLAHDLGHSPFGHSGEATLDRLMLERMGLDAGDVANKGRGFNHTLQSLRVVDELEARWSGFKGLNLTWESLEGIVKHATEYDAVSVDWMRPYEPTMGPSLEAQIVNFADELTYSAHDLDDGLRSGMIHMEMPELCRLAIWQEATADLIETDPELRRHRIIRRVIDLLITDLVHTSAARLDAAAPSSPDDVRRAGQPLMAISAEMAAMQRELKDFLYANLYRHWRVVRMFRKAERVLVELFEAFEQDWRQLPASTQSKLQAIGSPPRPGAVLSPKGYRVICDYLAGMTDRYALQEHKRLYDPFERA